MYEDVGASRFAGAAIGGTTAAGAALPATGVALLQIAGIALLVLAAGVMVLRISTRKRVQSD